MSDSFQATDRRGTMTDFLRRRTVMVDSQVRTADVTKFPIIDALLTIPREDYVPREQRETAYLGENLPIGEGRVILDPRSFAKLLDALDIGPRDLVLDLGCGLGYSTAVISRLAEGVVAVEEDAVMAQEAEHRLFASGIDNAAVVTGPLAAGAARHGPFDVVIVEGAVEALPDAIAAQMKEGGRIGCLFMEGRLGVARFGVKGPGAVSWRHGFNASAPIVPGFEKTQEFSL